MNVVIIEDERLTAKDLERTITTVEPGATIVASLKSVEESLAFFTGNENYDLVFSDIRLGDGLSFEIFEKINIKAPIIYCTAYNQYALDAFKTLGIDYLIKPFSRKTVAGALKKYKTIKNTFTAPKENYSELLSMLKNNMEPKKMPSLIIQRGDKITPIQGSDIAVFYIESTGVYAHTFSGKRHMVSYTLNELEDTYNNFFFRANRQFLVNRKAIKDASHYFHRKMIVNLNITFKEQILVGKNKVTPFLNWLTQN